MRSSSLILLFTLLCNPCRAQNFPFKAFQNHDDRVSALAFSPDTRTLASGARDKNLVINEIESRKSLLKIAEHYEPIKFVAFSKDGAFLYAGSRSVFSITDVLQNKVDRKLTNLTEITKIAPTNDPAIVFLVSNSRLIELNWKSGATKTIKSGSVSDFRLSQDGETLFIAEDKVIEVYSLKTFSTIKILSGHKSSITSLDYDDNKKRLVSSSASEIILWNVEPGVAFPYEYRKVTQVRFIQNGNSILFSSKNFLNLRELESAKDLVMFTGSAEIDYFDVSSDNHLIAVAADASKIKLFDNPWVTEGLQPKAALQIVRKEEALSPQEKYALIIGVKSYEHVPPLRNSLNDAQDMAATLKGKGFTVIEVYDPKTKREMQEGIKSYFSLVQDKPGATGLVFYSGHGMQVKGINYLIPTQADPQIEADLDDQCVNMDYVMRAINQAGNGLNIFVLDACRNNPFQGFSRSAEKGLSMVDTPKGSYIVYATKPGSVASDGTGRNGLFTSKLLQYMNTQGLNIEQVFKQVARDVSTESGDAQRPWIASDFTGDFFFTPTVKN